MDLEAAEREKEKARATVVDTERQRVKEPVLDTAPPREKVLVLAMVSLQHQRLDLDMEHPQQDLGMEHLQQDLAMEHLQQDLVMAHPLLVAAALDMELLPQEEDLATMHHQVVVDLDTALLLPTVVLVAILLHLAPLL